jgi:hypothetical protein
MTCRKCGCKMFIWNPVSAYQKSTWGTTTDVSEDLQEGVHVDSHTETPPPQDNKSDQVAYRNCLCGHHYNYHD